jgi:uncharacterized membrane protein YgcG
MYSDVGIILVGSLATPKSVADLRKGTRMLRSPLLIAGLSLSLLAGTYVVGCGDDVDTTTVVDQEGKQPPGPPASGATPASGSVTFAVSKLYLGDTDRSGAPSPSAWKQYGYNLDSKVSTKASTDLCKPAAGGAPSAVYPDGNEGIDNAFGKIILPIITGLASDASQTINDNIAAGEFTIMMDVEGLGPDADYLDLPTRLYAGGTLPTAPKWDGTDSWPVVQELLNDPTDIKSSKVRFDTAYVTSHTWVSGSPGVVNLSLAVAGFSLTLTISEAILTMDIDPSRNEATGGVIAGILETEPLINELRKIAGSFDEGLCTGTTFDSLADQLRQASDMIAAGDQDPSKECDGISIGLGFDAKPVLLGDILDAAPPQPDPCSGGTGGGGNSGTGGGGNSGTGGGGTGGSTSGTGGGGGAGGN